MNSCLIDERHTKTDTENLSKKYKLCIKTCSLNVAFYKCMIRTHKPAVCVKAKLFGPGFASVDAICLENVILYILSPQNMKPFPSVYIAK